MVEQNIPGRAAAVGADSTTVTALARGTASVQDQSGSGTERVSATPDMIRDRYGPSFPDVIHDL